MKIEQRKEGVIIASDMNRKLGNDGLGIKGTVPRSPLVDLLLENS